MAGSRRTLTITQANLDHNHLYLTACIDLFPPDAIGGARKASEAPKTVQVDFGSGHVVTDVVGKRKIFRRRGWVRRFFAENNLAAGDCVILERIGPYAYRVFVEPLELTCLSIQQPWADLILDGKKQVENRSWSWTGAQELHKAGEKTTLGIHVSSYLTVWQGLTDTQRDYFAPGWSGSGTSGGVVAGIVELIRICRWEDLPQSLQRHKYTQKEFGPWHWVVANPRRLVEPVPWPGNTRTFTVEIPRRLLPVET